MMNRYLFFLLASSEASNTLARGRGPASTTAYGSSDGSEFLLMLVLAAFYFFIASNFGMTLLVFSIITAAVAGPLVLAWYTFQDASPVEAIAYSSLLISLYW